MATRGGVPVKSITPQHPCASIEAIPSIVTSLFLSGSVQMDYANMAAGVTCPVILIGGTADSIASPDQLGSQYRSLVNAPGKVLYYYSTDSHGSGSFQQKSRASPGSDQAPLRVSARSARASRSKNSRRGTSRAPMLIR